MLESRQASEQLSAEGNFILMPDRAQSPLCGRLEKGFLADIAPSLILTKYLLCITWRALHPTFIFPGQVSNSLGRFVFHLAGPRPCPTQQAHAGVSGILPHEKLAPLSLNLHCASGNYVSLKSYLTSMAAVHESLLHTCMHIHKPAHIDALVQCAPCLPF